MSALIALSRGVRVAIGERALPEACDVALVQDAGMAYALADRWPETPQVFRAPSSLYDFQSPPQLPGDRRRGRRVQRPHGAARRGAGRRARDRAAAPADRHQAHVPARRDPLPPAARAAARQLRLPAPPRADRGGVRARRASRSSRSAPTARLPRPRGRDRRRRHRGRQGARDPRRDGVRARRLRARRRRRRRLGHRRSATPRWRPTTSPATRRDWSLDHDSPGDLAGYDPATGPGQPRPRARPPRRRRPRPGARWRCSARLSPRAEPATGPLREMARLVRLQWASDQDVIALRQALLEERARAVIAEELRGGPRGGAGAARRRGRTADRAAPLAGAVSAPRPVRPRARAAAPGRASSCPTHVALGGHVIIYDGVVIEPGCRTPGRRGDRQAAARRSPTARSASTPAAAETVLERAAAVGCQGVIVAGARLRPGWRPPATTRSIRERVVLEAGAVVGLRPAHRARLPASARGRGSCPAR